MIRKIVTLPFNIIAFVIALVFTIIIRAKEIAIGLERKIDIFEQAKGKKK